MNHYIQYLEYAGVAFGVLNVILAAFNNIWCWPIGIASSAIYIYLNIIWQLPYDGSLQVFYVVAGFYGWWQWGKKTEGGELPIIRWSFKKQIPLLLLGIVLSIPLGCFTYFLFYHTPITFADATLTVFSFLATWMMAKKIIDNWLWWIVIDTAYIGLYWIKGQNVTCVLFVVLTIGAAAAYFNWLNEIKNKKRIHSFDSN